MNSHGQIDTVSSLARTDMQPLIGYMSVGRIEQEKVRADWTDSAQRPALPIEQCRSIKEIFDKMGWKSAMATVMPEATILARHDNAEDTTRAKYTTPLVHFFLWSWIKNTINREEIAALLNLHDLSSISDRLAYLHKLPADDPDEKPIDLESVRRFAFFIIINRHRLFEPQIGISPDGLVGAEWWIADRGILSVEFLPSEDVKFTTIFWQVGHDDAQRCINGKLPPDKMMDVVWPHIGQWMCR